MPATTPSNSEGSPCRVCITPTRNEAWIIDKFLAAARCWANEIVVADQNSTDGTADAISKSPKTHLVRNESPVYDESHRQRLLLSRARRFPGRRILIGLDADEALTSNSLDSPEWALIEHAKPGTVLRFRWINVLPGFKTAWIRPGHVALGFVDDGSEHSGRTIHSPRVPEPPDAPVIDLNDIAVLHFQFVLWERMESKQRWYQAWEHHKNLKKGPLDIFRQYNHMHGGWKSEEVTPVEQKWFSGYVAAGIDFSTLQAEAVTWWDREIVQMLIDRGPDYFRRIAIWDKNWEAVRENLGVYGPSLRDPRSRFERWAQRALSSTQSKREKLGTRLFERYLRFLGW